MLCCLNPDCLHPLNTDGMKYCQSCGTQLTTVFRGRYRIINLLSDEGGFGRTYLAEDIDKLNDKCVVKQLAPKVQGTWALKKAVELFQEEAKRLQQLGEHPQIPHLFAYFEQDNNLYLVQEFIDGKDLSKELSWRSPYQENEIKDVLLDLLPVIKFIHEHGVIHRDIKPQNIIRRQKDGRLVLIDFGASKQLSTTVQTQQGTTIGSHGYTPIEQMRGGEAYPASDLFSLGATCFYLLTGVLPSELWIQQGYGWVASWQQYLPNPVSDRLAQVLDKLLQIDVHNRYQSADDAIANLTLPPPQTPVPHTIISPPQPFQPSVLPIPGEKSTKPLLTGVMVLLLTLGAGAGGVAYMQSRSSKIATPATPATPIAYNYLLNTTLKGHNDEISSIAISQDGTKLASGSDDNSIKLWDLAKNEVIQTLKGHSEAVWAVTFSPDGKILASGGQDKKIILWDTQTGKQISSLGDTSLKVTSLAISSNGKILVSGEQNTIKLWDLQTKKEIKTLTGHSDVVSAVVISPDNTTLISSSWDKTIKVWDLKTKKVVKTLMGNTKKVFTVAISPNGRMIASAGSDKTIRLWNLLTKEPIATLEGHKGDIVSVAFTPDGKTLASGSYDSTIKLWNLETKKEISTLQSDPGRVTAVAFQPNGKVLISSRGDSIHIWQMSKSAVPNQ